MKSIVNLDSPLVSPPSDFEGDFFKGTESRKHVIVLTVFLMCLAYSEQCNIPHVSFGRNPQWLNRRGTH